MNHDALLQTLLHELKDGVVVCDPVGRIILHNGAARNLFGRSQLLAEGRSLYNFCLQSPVEQALSLLHYQHARKNQSAPLHFVQFMNASINQELFFSCRASLLPSPVEGKNSFVVLFEDITAYHVPENPLVMKIEEFRAPMTNLRAAVENLTEYPEMSPVMRSAFENVLVQESLNLTEAFNSLADSCQAIMQNQNHLTALNTELFFGYVKSHLESRGIVVAAEPQAKTGAQVDIYGLMLVLDYLTDRIQQEQERSELSCEVHIGEQFMYFDFIWQGSAFPTAAVAKMLEKRLAPSVGKMTVDAILHTMGGDIWSLQRQNSSMLRLALPNVANKSAIN